MKCFRQAQISHQKLDIRDFKLSKTKVLDLRFCLKVLLPAIAQISATKMAPQHPTLSLKTCDLNNLTNVKRYCTILVPLLTLVAAMHLVLAFLKISSRVLLC